MSKKSLTKNYIYNLIYQVLTLVLPLITTPYLSRVLGATPIGIYSYTYSIVSYFLLFGALGVGLYGQREIAYVSDDKKAPEHVLRHHVHRQAADGLAVVLAPEPHERVGGGRC